MKPASQEKIEQDLSQQLHNVANIPHINQESKVYMCTNIARSYLLAILKDEQDISVFLDTLDDSSSQILTGKGLCSELDKMRAQSPKGFSVNTEVLHGRILQLMSVLDISEALDEISKIGNPKYIMNDIVDVDFGTSEHGNKIDFILSIDPDIHLS